MREIAFFLASWLALASSASYANQQKTIERLRAELNSMQACRASLEREDCNLDILEPEVRANLEQIHALQNLRSPTVTNGLPGVGQRLKEGAVQFFTDQVWDEKEGVTSLLGGSKWSTGSLLLLPAQEVLGVMSGPNTAVFYGGGTITAGTLIEGIVIPSNGILTTVIDEEADGAVLWLANGMILSIGSYDRYDTGYWLPPYDVIIDAGSMKMWHLQEGKSVWIERIRQ